MSYESHTAENQLPRMPSASIFVKSKEEALADVRSWLQTAFEEKKGFFVPKREVFGAYAAFCAENNYESTTPASFGKFLKRVYPCVETRRLIRNNEQAMYYFNLKRKDASETPPAARPWLKSSSPAPAVSTSTRPTLLLPKTTTSPPTHRRRTGSDPKSMVDPSVEQDSGSRLTRSSSPHTFVPSAPTPSSSLPLAPTFRSLAPAEVTGLSMLAHQPQLLAPLSDPYQHLQRIHQLQQLCQLQQYQQVSDLATPPPFPPALQLPLPYALTDRYSLPHTGKPWPATHLTTPSSGIDVEAQIQLINRALAAAQSLGEVSPVATTTAYTNAQPWPQDEDPTRSSHSPPPSRRRGTKRHVDATEPSQEEHEDESKAARLGETQEYEHAQASSRQSPRGERKQKEKARLAFILN